jgi:hypothetical protein
VRRAGLRRRSRDRKQEAKGPARAALRVKSTIDAVTIPENTEKGTPSSSRPPLLVPGEPRAWRARTSWRRVAVSATIRLATGEAYPLKDDASPEGQGISRGRLPRTQRVALMAEEICPICRDAFDDPVVCGDGYCYFHSDVQQIHQDIPRVYKRYHQAI